MFAIGGNDLGPRKTVNTFVNGTKTFFAFFYNQVLFHYFI